jgi:hypothetical protein
LQAATAAKAHGDKAQRKADKQLDKVAHANEKRNRVHDHYNKTLEKLAEAEEAADAAENVDPKP